MEKETLQYGDTSDKELEACLDRLREWIESGKLEKIFNEMLGAVVKGNIAKAIDLLKRFLNEVWRVKLDVTEKDFVIAWFGETKLNLYDMATYVAFVFKPGIVVSVNDRGFYSINTINAVYTRLTEALAEICGSKTFKIDDLTP